MVIAHLGNPGLEREVPKARGLGLAGFTDLSENHQ